MPILDKVFLQIFNMSFTASIVILFVIAIRIALKKAPKIFSYALWAVVLFRLLVPFSFESAYSLLPINVNPISQDIIYEAEPAVDTGIILIDQTVNSSLPAATPETSVNPIQIMIGLASFIWILGIIILLTYSIISLMRLRSRLKTAQYDRENIYRSSEIESPFVLGLIRPKIYLPASLTSKEENYIILHEQTHIRRGDHITRILAFLALCLHWFNPLVWLAFFLSGRDMEMSCDEAVIRELGSDLKKNYSSSLLALATGRPIINGSPLAFGEGDTKGRVQNVLTYKKPSFWLLLIALLLCILAIFSLISNPIQTRIYNPAVQEYIVGASGILGSVDKESFTKISPDFSIGADKYGRAVFKDPHQALATFEILYSDTIELIKSEYDLKSFSHKNHEAYKVYGSQMGFNEGDPEMLARCVFVSQFLDIYENSFDKTIPDTSYVQPTVNISEELWQARTDYVGNNSAVGKLIGLLIVPDGLSYDHFRLQTDNDQPYGIEIYYFVPSENLSSYDVENSPVLAEFRKNALILLALVDNADYVRAVLTDGERELGFTNGREWADYTMGRDVRDYAESPDKLEELLALKFSNSDSADKGDQALNPTPGQDELYKDRIADWLEDQARATYEPYYEVLDFIISDYREENISDTAGQRVEAIFLYTMISKNYDRDPDTVGYIIEAKENNSPYYQQMYDEYLAPRESNFEFKVIIDANDQMTLYSNISPKGTQWEETVFDDYIMK